MVLRVLAGQHRGVARGRFGRSHGAGGPGVGAPESQPFQVRCVGLRQRVRPQAVHHQQDHQAARGRQGIPVGCRRHTIAVSLVVLPLRGVAALSYLVDRYIIDALVNLCGWVPRAVGSLLRSLQTGMVQFYALAMVLGMLVLLGSLRLAAVFGN